MSQITEERCAFPSDEGLVRQEEASWHTGVAFVVRVDKAGSSTVTPSRRRDKWLEQVEDKTAGEVQSSVLVS